MENNYWDCKSLTVVVPTYNEFDTIAVIIERLVQIPHLLEIIVVNDGSTDGTGETLDKLSLEYSQLCVMHHPKNKGKTAALKTGFLAAKGEIILIQDADLEYDPQEIAAVIDPILNGQADVVYGSRFLVRKAARVLYFYHYLANKFLTFLMNLFTNMNMTDINTCYKAFKSEIIKNMIITSSGFGFDTEVTAKIAKLRCRVFEVPISYYGRTYEEGKKIGLKDGIYAIWYILYFNLFCSIKSSFHMVPKSINHKLAKTSVKSK
jgi:glycosyltransferase involved in cell wall biosynthesis